MWSPFAHQENLDVVTLLLKTGKKNNNRAHPDYSPSIFPQAVLGKMV